MSHPDRATLEAYVARGLAPGAAAGVDRHVATCPACRAALGATVAPSRLAAGWDGIDAALGAPRPTRFERVLVRVGVPEPAARLMAATPALRAGWVAATAVVLAFALGATNGAGTTGPERLAVFLALAPVVPCAGVALALGPATDPMGDVARAAPLSGFRLVLVRTAAVVVAAMALTAAVAVVAPEGGWLRFGWLLPSLAVTAATLALASRLGPVRAAGVAGAAWLGVAVTVAGLSDDAVALYGPSGQVACAAVAVAAIGATIAARRRYEQALP